MLAPCFPNATPRLIGPTDRRSAGRTTVFLRAPHSVSITFRPTPHRHGRGSPAARRAGCEPQDALVRSAPAAPLRSRNRRYLEPISNLSRTYLDPISTLSRPYLGLDRLTRPAKASPVPCVPCSLMSLPVATRFAHCEGRDHREGSLQTETIEATETTAKEDLTWQHSSPGGPIRSRWRWPSASP